MAVIDLNRRPRVLLVPVQPTPQLDDVMLKCPDDLTLADMQLLRSNLGASSPKRVRISWELHNKLSHLANFLGCSTVGDIPLSAIVGMFTSPIDPADCTSIQRDSITPPL